MYGLATGTSLNPRSDSNWRSLENVMQRSGIGNLLPQQSRLDEVLSSDDGSNRAGVESIGQPKVNMDSLSGDKQVGGCMGAEGVLNVQPKRPVSSSIINRQDHRASLVQPQAEIAATDHPGDGLPVREQGQLVGCLDLEER